MAVKVGIGNIVASYAQSAGWKLLNQLVNSQSKFGIFDQSGNPFYENGLNKTEITLLDKSITFAGGTNGSEAGVIALNYSKSYSITNAPVEEGKLVSVNLVEQPRQGQVTYVSTGTEKQRKLFEDALENVENSLVLYHLHTAERLMKNIKITGHSVSRSSSQGAQLVHYQINFAEILETPRSTSLRQATPNSNDSQSQGTIQPQTATGSQKQAAAKQQ